MNVNQIFYLMIPSWRQNVNFIKIYTEKTVSLMYGQRKNFFELKKVLLIQKNVLCSKQIDLFTLR